MTVRVIQGDCRDVLATLPAQSVHCCVTSPPYWGLRAYGTDPQIWGGDVGCAHEWEAETLPPRPVEKRTPEEFSRKSTLGPGRDGLRPTNAGHLVKTTLQQTACGTTCVRCGAWRGELGSEPTPEMYVANLVAVFREVRRVLRDDGTVWLNLGDSYFGGGGYYPDAPSNRNESKQSTSAGSVSRRERVRSSQTGLKHKDLIGIPWRVALALQAPWITCRGCGTENHAHAWARFPNGRRICPACEKSAGWDVSEAGWYLRSDIIWAKPNPMPESVGDRPTRSHEYVFLLTKRARYFYDAEAVKEPAVQAGRVREDKMGGNKGDAVHHSPGGAFNGSDTRNIRSVWTIPTHSFSAAHFATFPERLVEPMILAGTSERGACPACGAPWVRVVERTSMVIARSGRGSEMGEHGRTQSSGTMVSPASSVTTGWQPTCTCDGGEPVPCVCLDPFAGAGTVGLVAERLGRDAVLIELNGEYVQMAARRIRDASPLFSRVDVEQEIPA